MAADRVGRAHRLLLQAVESLESGSASSSSPQAQHPSPVQDNPMEGCSNASRVLAERNRLFNFGKKRDVRQPSKKKRKSMWTHDFVCLSSTKCMRPPTSLQAGELMRAGLGKKPLSVFSLAESSELHEEILDAFPKLKDGGGYELLRVGESSGKRGELVAIPQPPEGYTVDYVKEVVRQAKVYIRPLQRDLSTEASLYETEIEASIQRFSSWLTESELEALVAPIVQ